MARWSDLATWRGPTVNEGDGDGTPLEDADAVTEVRGLVVHIAEGYFEGTISYEKNPDAKVSSHFVSGRDGGRAQMVDTHDRAWTQSSGNPYWLSIENEGFTLTHPLHKPGWERLTPQQIEFNAQLLARIHREYGVPLKLATSPSDKGLAYHSLGAEHGVNWGHPDCPGEPIKAQLPEILARATQIANGDDDMGWQDELTAGADGDFKTYKAQDWMIGSNIVGWRHILPAVLAIEAAVDAIAKKVDLDPAELDAVKESARAGATLALKSIDPQAIADAISDDVAQEVVDALAARLAAKQS